MQMNEQIALRCLSRVLSLGYRNVQQEKITGLFSAHIFHIQAQTKCKEVVRLTYKEPSAGENVEYDLFQKIGDTIGRWGPKVIAWFDEEPKAILLNYLGEPLLRLHTSVMKEAQSDVQVKLEQAADVLLDLHLYCYPLIESWVTSKTVMPYSFKQDWANRFLKRIGPEHSELHQIAIAFYDKYSAQWIRAPRTLTHGDPNWGNVLVEQQTISLIDWEWCQAATPMRDLAILVQEVHDDLLIDAIAKRHAMKLVQSGYPTDIQCLMHDFNLMLIDNAFMTAAWDCVLFDRGNYSQTAIEQKIRQKKRRIMHYWARVLDSES
jgi:thiamine kinase-like enzyme